MEILGASTFVLAYFAAVKVYMEKMTVKLKQLLMLGAIIGALPFAFELVLFMEVAGIEVAYSCLMLMLAPVINAIKSFIDKVKQFTDLSTLLIKQHPMFQRKIYLGHAVICSLTFVLTSSLVLSTSVWLPIFMMGNQLT